MLNALAMTMLAQTAGPGAEWRLTALDAAFPFDGARCAGTQIHDPSIIRAGDRYVMVTTSGHELAPLSTSTDLLNWTTHGPILADRPAWLEKAIPQHRSVWAPAPILVGTTLRVYYCASARFGRNTSWIAYAECPNFDPARPLEGWVDRGPLISSKEGESNFNAIDPDVFIGPDGRHWMVYGSYWSGMYQVELDPETGALKDPAAAPRHVASNPENGNPLEAPAMFFRDGWYYLGVTYGLAAQGVKSTYRMVVGRSRTPEGPFLGPDGKPMTEGGHASLVKSSSPMFGPGGGNFFLNAQGDLMMAFHFYDGRLFWNGDNWGAPHLQVRTVLWGEDGWPLPGLPVGAALSHRTGSSPDGAWILQIGFGHVVEIQLRPDGTVALASGEPDPNVLGWSEGEGRLSLKLSGRGEAYPAPMTWDESRRYAVGRDSAGQIIRLIEKEAAR